MILTLTVNPALDRILTVDQLVFEDRGYILSKTVTAGGRGIVASKVIASFGGETLAILPAGGEHGERLKNLLKDAAYPSEIYPVTPDARVNLTISDRNGLTIQLNELGPTLTHEDEAGLTRLVSSRLPGASWLLLTGSLPPGISAAFYANLIAAARPLGVQVLLDTDHEALVEGIEQGPTVTAPNQFEAERLLGTALVTRQQFFDAARRIHTMGAKSVILSLGSRGAVGLFGGSLFEVVPPRVDAVCPIGSGDALSAAFVWAMTQAGDPVDALRWGVAAGTASAMLPGITLASLEETRRVYTDVAVRPVAG